MPESEDLEVSHLDGNSWNCRPENLRWVTHSENCHMKRAHGTLLRGSSHPCTRFSVQECIAVLRALDEGKSIRAVGKEVGMSPETVRRIRDGGTANAQEAHARYALEIQDPLMGIGL